MFAIHLFISIYLFIYLFGCNNLLSLFLQNIRRPVLFSYKLITFNSSWSIDSPRETAVDTVLEVSENSHRNVYTEVLNEVVAS